MDGWTPEWVESRRLGDGGWVNGWRAIDYRTLRSITGRERSGAIPPLLLMAEAPGRRFWSIVSSLASAATSPFSFLVYPTSACNALIIAPENAYNTINRKAKLK